MNWIRLPIKLSKAVDLEREEDLGIEADEFDGTIYLRTDRISHLLGEETTTTMWLKNDTDYVIDLPIGDIISLINQAESEE